MRARFSSRSVALCAECLEPLAGYLPGVTLCAACHDGAPNGWARDFDDADGALYVADVCAHVWIEIRRGADRGEWSAEFWHAPDDTTTRGPWGYGFYSSLADAISNGVGDLARERARLLAAYCPECGARHE